MAGDRKISAGTANDIPDFSAYQFLVVDDDPIIRRIALELLGNTGAQVHVANDGRHALTMLREDLTVDVVLMDIEMPHMNGYAASKAILTELGSQAPVIIALTAHTGQVHIQQCFDSGMRGYTLKPFDPAWLFSVLGQALEIPMMFSASAQTVKADANQPLLPHQVNGISIADGLMRVGHNQQLYLSLLRQFIDGHGQDVGRIRNAFMSGDFPLARLLLHGVRGVASSIGAHEVGQQAIELDRVLKTRDVDESLHALDAFSEALAEMIGSAVH
ncbi:MAG: response regulator, partial [Pseudomonadota bacterium]